MITALAIAAIVLTALLALSLPWFGWGPGIDAAGRGMAIFFPAILMGLRVSCLAVAAIVLAAAPCRPTSTAASTTRPGTRPKRRWACWSGPMS